MLRKDRFKAPSALAVRENISFTPDSRKRVYERTASSPGFRRVVRPDSSGCSPKIHTLGSNYYMSFGSTNGSRASEIVYPCAD
jgi:hypothetical protein